ncbi:hypothetical protein ACQPYK_47955 [Streptosporangium sp. CA-135522]
MCSSTRARWADHADKRIPSPKAWKEVITGPLNAAAACAQIFFAQ